MYKVLSDSLRASSTEWTAEQVAISTNYLDFKYYLCKVILFLLLSTFMIIYLLLNSYYNIYVTIHPATDNQASLKQFGDEKHLLLPNKMLCASSLLVVFTRLELFIMWRLLLVLQQY